MTTTRAKFTLTLSEANWDRYPKQAGEPEADVVIEFVDTEEAGAL